MVSIVICLTAAGIYLARSKPTYQSTAGILVLESGRLNVSGTDPLQGLQGGQNALNTHIMLIRSPAIVGKAIEMGKLKDLSVGAIIRDLSVRLPDNQAKVIEVKYISDHQGEARKVVQALLDSYKAFLKDNYQQNASEVIKLIVNARDELSKELKTLEQEYLEFRQQSPTYTADPNGRPYVARRLDQWDMQANQVMTRILQLQQQLDLARELAAEGAGLDIVANAMSQLSLTNNGAPVAPAMNTANAGQTDNTRKTYEQLVATLDDLEYRRRSAERLLENLKAEEAALLEATPVDENRLIEAFYSDPEVASLRGELERARLELGKTSRITARGTGDPVTKHWERQVRDLQAALDRLWQERRPRLMAVLSTPQESEAIKKAKAEIVALRAQETTLREQLETTRVEQLARLRSEHARFVESHGPEHERVKALEDRIAALTRPGDGGDTTPTGSFKVASLIDSIEVSLKSLESMRAEIQQQFERDLKESKDAEIAQLTESNIKSNLDRQKALFDSVTSQLKQAQLASDFGTVSAQTISPPNEVPVRPSLLFILSLAVVAGTGLGMCLAFVADLLEARVRTLVELRSILDVPTLAVVPQMPPDQIAATSNMALLSHEAPRSLTAESYKSARTNLEFMRRTRRAQVLLISSPNPGDGKSTTSSNLAISLAKAGRKVLLIDADLRKPSLHGIYNLPRDRGIARVIMDEQTVDEAVQPTHVENLDLLTTGPDVPNPAELLASPRLAEFVEEVRARYDAVIFDTSPFLAVTDPWIIAAVVDAITLVVRMGETRRQDVERTMEVLKTLDAPVLGVVVNGIMKEHVGYGTYGRHYGYGYGYGYPYGKPYGSNTGTTETTDGDYEPRQIEVAGVGHRSNGSHHGHSGAANGLQDKDS